MVSNSKSHDRRDRGNDDQYNEDPRYSPQKYDRKMRYAEQKSAGGGCCCSIPKILIFLLFLGGGLGAVFGFVSLEDLENFFTGAKSSDDGGNSNNGGGGDGNDGGDTQPQDPVPYSFMQCPTDGGSCCNGLESNCDLNVNEAMYAFVHNANHDELLVPNNEAPLEGALEAGYRGIMLDVCMCDDENDVGELVFCHGVCGIGRRDPIEVFKNINTFLTDNPTEIIIVNFEMSVGSPTSSDLWLAMASNDSFKKKVYNHVPGTAWPTMQEMLTNGKQLIAFQHNDDSCTSTTFVGCATRIEDYFAYVYENHWDFKDVDAIRDTANSCTVKRGGTSTQDFYSLNNFVTATFGPSKSSADILNRKDFLNDHIGKCEDITGLEVNFINVDFWQRGDLPEIVQEINKERGGKKKRRSLSMASRLLRWWREGV